MMADIEITVDGGTSKRLLTAGKYCDKNILVTATGGGDSLQVLSGTFIPSDDIKQYTIEHNLGKIPKIACYFISDENLYEKTNPTYRFALMCDFLKNGSLILASKQASNQLERKSYYKYPNNAHFYPVATEKNITFGGDGVNSWYFMFKAGVEYQWFLVG